jgi:putative ABC transport system substrate-binding protein
MIGFALALLPLLTGAQPGDEIWRIGYLSTAAGLTEQTQIFLHRLRELGYVEGQNLVVEYRWAAGKDERFAELASDLVRANVDLIVALGTPATLAAKQATPRIPIVFVAGDPVEKGIVASLAHPAGNLTGLALIASDSKPLELLKDAAPGMSSVAYLYDPATLPGTWGNARLEWYQDQARILDIALEPVALSKPGETEEVFVALPAGTNGLLLQSSPVNFLAQARICALAAAHRLPSASTDNGAAAAGCLISYGEDQADIARRRADYVDRILKGTPPADLPVEQPTTFKLIINLKTAKALGLTIPNLLLFRADEVIE